jgi:hypothetical protein
MATLLQIGRRVINIDLVFEIEDYGDRIRAFYAVPTGDGTESQAYADLDGEAANVFRAWLANNATQLLSPQEDTTSVIGDTSAASRLRQAAEAAARATEDNAAPANDNPFYGSARIRQMHGVGSDTQKEAGDATSSTD